MTVDQMKGVKFVDRDFWSDAMTVVAERPVPRSAPDHNERTYDFTMDIVKNAAIEGYPTVHLTLLD